MQAAAKEAGIVIGEPQEQIAVAVRAQGTAAPEKFAAWTTLHAQRLNLAGRVRSVGKDHVRALLAGPVERVSALVTSMHTGNLRERPDWVKTAPTRRDMPAEFQEQKS